MPGGGIPGGNLPGGGFEPSIRPTPSLPGGIGDTKELSLDISGIKFAPETGLPAGGGGSSSAGQKPITVVTPTDSHSKEIILEAVKGEYLYGRLGLLLGVLSIVGGVVLGLNGVAGSTSWTASLLGLKSQINDAAPGTVLFIVGLFMIWVTKPTIKMRDLRG